MQTLLIDGDILIYRAGFGVELSIDWDDTGVYQNYARLDDGIVYIERELEKIYAEVGRGPVIMALSDPQHNWRKRILPEYKSNRMGKRPLLYEPLREWMRDEFAVDDRQQLEADDVLGILSTSLEDSVIVSIDKDFLTIPGKLYNPMRPEDGIIEQSLEAADRYHLLQTLTGDTVDGYKGCPGVGPKTAEKYLDRGWPGVLEAFEKAGLEEGDALVQARVARILRAEDYSVVNGESQIKLWEPNDAGTE